MSRSNRYSDKENNQLQRLKHENEKLKRQITSLRKQLSRVDIDRYQNLKELVQQQYEEDQAEFKALKTKQSLRAQWLCHDCGQDVLKIVIVTRRDGDFYFRRCNHCGKRTKLQRYNDKIEGLIED
jgi:DNA-directed RNA polymerase subunit M/transcription elongation factor TFIIS